MLYVRQFDKGVSLGAILALAAHDATAANGD
jgi:hypothetical protein